MEEGVKRGKGGRRKGKKKKTEEEKREGGRRKKKKGVEKTKGEENILMRKSIDYICSTRFYDTLAVCSIY